MPGIRILGPGDEARLEAFLAPRTETAMLMRANALAAGLEDRGERLQATYAGAVEGEDLLGVAALCWNGALLLQADVHLEAVIGCLVRAADRAITGFQGPLEQVHTARRLLGLDTAPTSVDDPEGDLLYRLDLAGLQLPPLSRGRMAARLALPGETDFLARWRSDFVRDALGAVESAELLETCRQDVLALQAASGLWLLLVDDQPVATAAINCRVGEHVMVGGVWTPPEQRGRGFARAIVGASLAAERASGARRAMLLASPDNPSAQAAYESLGFRLAGRYGFVLLAQPRRPLQAPHA